MSDMTPDAGVNPEPEAASDSTTDSSTDITTTQDTEITKNQGKPTDQVDWKEGDPLNKHPRFQEKIKEVHDKNAKIAELEAALKQTKQPAQQADDSLTEFDRNVDEYFKGIPAPKLKESYETLSELYADIEKNFFKRMTLAQKRDQDQENETKRQSNEAIKNELLDISDEIGETEYVNEFKPYLEKVLDIAEEKGVNVTVKSIFASYLSGRSEMEATKKVEPKKAGSQVSGSSKKGEAKPTELSAKDYSRLDMRELARIPASGS